LVRTCRGIDIDGLTYIHENRDNHELGVKGHERLILLQAVLLDKALLDDMEEVPVEPGIN
jgi:hypothetical protein